MEQFFISKVSKHYNLRHHNESKPSPLYLIIRVCNTQYKIPLGVKVLPQHFKNDKAMISFHLSQLDNNNNDLVNQKINEYDNLYNEFISYLCTNPNEVDNVKTIISNLFYSMGRKKKETRELAIAVLRQLLYDKPMSEGAKSLFHGVLDDFYEYLKTLKNDIYIEDIDVNLMKGYKKYISSQTVTHSITEETVSILDNTVNAKFKNILTILGYADKADIIDITKIRKLKENVIDHTEENQVYLEDNEIELLRNASLNGDDAQIRDIFLFQLDLGQRYSDIFKLCGKNIKNDIKDNFIDIIQKKCGSRVHIPLTPYALSVLEKYNYTLPKFKNGKMNIRIKEICKVVGIDAICNCREMRGGKPYEYSAKKYQLIGTHTARRSFVSNATAKGISKDLTASITGHKSNAINRYDRTTQTTKVNAFVEAMGNAYKSAGNAPLTLSKPSVSTTDQQTQGNALENEIKEVLVMFNVPAYLWYNTNDIEELYRLLISIETKICDKANVDYKILKDLFNDKNISMKDKVKTVMKMINKL